MKAPPFTEEWQYSTVHNSACRVIEEQTLWGQTVCRVWLPNQNAVARVPRSALRPLSADLQPEIEAERIAYVAAAAKVAEVLESSSSATEGHVLMAPMMSNAIPLPHQIHALSRAISGDRVRYLLADEVGLGKTIEAGLIMRELKLRGLVRRTLVIAPKGLVAQWVAEMRTHFGEEFRLLIPNDFSAYRRIAQEDNLWQSHPQVVCPMDSVKPLDGRRGWSREQVDEYNRERFEHLISAGWDLVIVDEAHRLGGSTDQVARYKLGQGLAEAAPYLLLLSATPHQGKTDAFHRLISLVDAQAFPDVSSVTKERVQPYVIRTEKRRAIDAAGKPLFKPRRTELAPVSWEDRHRDGRLLYEAVTAYVREGYNQAIAEKRSYIGFLMILMQRLVVSSTRAIRTTLERRFEVLEAPQEQLTLFPQVSEEEWAELDGQEQMEMLLKTQIEALKNERAEVKRLLEAAKRCEAQGPDAKAEALLDWIYRLQAEEGDPELKVLVFTEFVQTQEMLMRFLSERGFSAVCLNGSMDMEERKRVQDAFAKDVRILISTDAGGEGLNLQFCHVVINYDIPWNPMRLEQRIGRVDRIGQTRTVRAINFVFQDSVDHRVREVLEEKLAVIFEEFGIDKTGDVLDSAQAERIFNDLYVEAILSPEEVEMRVDELVKSIQEQAREARQSASMLGETSDLDPNEAKRLLAHPLPHWVERMTVSLLSAYGGKAEWKNGAWDLTWPSGERLTNVVFTSKEAEEKPFSRQLTLEDPKVRGLAMCLPPFAPGQPVPIITLPGLAPEIMGFWSLWRISISTADWNCHRIMPLFLTDDSRVFAPTAWHIWDQLLATKPTILTSLDVETSHQAFERLREAAERQGKTIYDELVLVHRERLTRERVKGEYAFAARRRAIERVGLPQVRNHRLSLLEQEEKRFREQLERRAQMLPEMVPLLLVRVEGNYGQQTTGIDSIV
jgi:superfamily II DNA or RNA helicase